MTRREQSANESDLVKVAYASDESEAELLQGLLRTATDVREARGHIGRWLTPRFVRFALCGIGLQSPPILIGPVPLGPAGPQTVLGESDAPVKWVHRKGPHFAGSFREAAEGIRTLDLLHGNQ
jgi:hypothetical protein